MGVQLNAGRLALRCVKLKLNHSTVDTVALAYTPSTPFHSVCTICQLFILSISVYKLYVILYVTGVFHVILFVSVLVCLSL